MPSRRPIRAAAALGLLFAMVLNCGAARAQQDPPGRVGRIAAVQGGVWADESGDWVSALRNRPFTAGDRLATDAASAVELEIGSTTAYLGPESELEALRLDDERVVLQLHRGSVALRVLSGDVADEFEVLTAQGSFLPLRSGAYRVDQHDDGSDASVWRGDLQFVAPDWRETLASGQRAQFWREGPQQLMRSRALTPQNDDFALAFLRLDETASRSAPPPYLSPEMTGIDDLDRYGQWQQTADFGAVWIPSSVAAGWAPYRQGHWAWIRPWGWTWVDDAPWGFAPFHYGRWLYWGNRWAWAPGPRVVRPVYAPALVAWVGGPNFSVAIGGRTGPAVGWMPLGPHEAYRPGYPTSPRYVDRLNDGRRWDPARPHFNRGAPGAVTVVPGGALVPRQPVAGAAWRVDEGEVQRAFRDRHFDDRPPGAPVGNWRGNGAPRTALPGQPAAPFAPPPRGNERGGHRQPERPAVTGTDSAGPFRPTPAPGRVQTAPASPPPASTQRPYRDAAQPAVKPSDPRDADGSPRPPHRRDNPPPMRITVPPAGQPQAGGAVPAPPAQPSPQHAQRPQRGKPFAPGSPPPAGAAPPAPATPNAAQPAAESRPRRRTPESRATQAER